MIILLNLRFADWTQIFGDERLTAALLDRLTHGRIFRFSGAESYRFRERMRKRAHRASGEAGLMDKWTALRCAASCPLIRSRFADLTGWFPFSTIKWSPFSIIKVQKPRSRVVPFFDYQMVPFSLDKYILNRLDLSGLYRVETHRPSVSGILAQADLA